MTATRAPLPADYYAILQVGPSADGPTIERAYRHRLAARGSGAGQESESWAAVEQAYQVVSDPYRRQAYDEQRRQWLTDMVRSLDASTHWQETPGASWDGGPDCPILRAALALVADERRGQVLAIDAGGHVQWVFTGLDAPAAPTWAEQGQVLVCEEGRDRVLLLAPAARQVLRTVSALRRSGREVLPLKGPRDAVRLPVGTLLITDTLRQRVVEVDEDDEIVWQFGNVADEPDSPGGQEDGELCSPVAACRLENGNTLITDAGNGRLVEATPGGRILWSFPPRRRFGLGSSVPGSAWINCAVRLVTGNTLLVTDRVQEVGRSGDLLWEYAPAATDISRAYPLVSGDLLLDVTRVDSWGLSKSLQAVDRSGEVVWEQTYSRLQAAHIRTKD